MAQPPEADDSADTDDSRSTSAASEDNNAGLRAPFELPDVLNFVKPPASANEEEAEYSSIMQTIELDLPTAVSVLYCLQADNSTDKGKASDFALPKKLYALRPSDGNSWIYGYYPRMPSLKKLQYSLVDFVELLKLTPPGESSKLSSATATIPTILQLALAIYYNQHNYGLSPVVTPANTWITFNPNPAKGGSTLRLGMTEYKLPR